MKQRTCVDTHINTHENKRERPPYLVLDEVDARHEGGTGDRRVAIYQGLLQVALNGLDHARLCVRVCVCVRGWGGGGVGAGEV